VIFDCRLSIGDSSICFDSVEELGNSIITKIGNRQSKIENLSQLAIGNDLTIGNRQSTISHTLKAQAQTNHGRRQ